MIEEIPFQAELTPRLALKAMQSADRILRHAQDLCARLDEDWVMSDAPKRIVGPLMDLGLDVQNFQALAYENAEPGKTMPIEDLFGKLVSRFEDQHPDDLAVDRFAAAMKAKLAKKREQGFGGWEDKTAVEHWQLVGMLREHVRKGDPLDVMNLCMMLYERGEPTTMEKEVELDGPELWEILLSIDEDAAGAISDDNFQKLADAINKGFIRPAPLLEP